MTTIMLVADLTLYRRALAAVLSTVDGFHVLSDVDTARAPDAARSLPADVAVVDLNTRRTAGFGAVRAIADLAPDCRLLAVTGTTPQAALHTTLASRVSGFLSVDSGTRELIAAIRRVAAGERFGEPAVARAGLRVPRNPLTPREIDVLRLAADGLPAGDIASALFLSEGTVRNYLSAVARKLGARSRTESIRTATEANWL